MGKEISSTITHFLDGKHLYLRPLARADLNETYLSWLSDPEVTRYMLTGTFPVNMERLGEYYDRMTTSPNHVILAIWDKQPNRHIGNITLNDIDWVSRVANLGIMIGEKQFWDKGYGAEATELMVRYAFDRLNLHKIWLGVYADHEAAMRLYTKVGFKVEGRFQNHLYRDGKYFDMVIMGFTRERLLILGQ